MLIAAIVVALVACVFIIVIGTRFLVSPTPATTAYGIPAGDARGLTAIKGVRDIVSGVVLLVVLAAGGPTVLGWALLAAALTPVGDAIIVAARGGRPATVLGVHGLTAALLVAAGLVILLT